MFYRLLLLAWLPALLRIRTGVLQYRRACGSAVFRSRSLRSASENDAGRSAGMGRWNSAPGTIAIPRFGWSSTPASPRALKAVPRAARA
jgi:hypothetical protein